jgi:hypothetical protein
MAEPVRKSTPSLYRRDFCAWTEEQSGALKARDLTALDWDNLAEEVESLGRREKSEIQSRLRVLLTHLLKWQFQPERRNYSWQSTIGEQRAHLFETLQASPSLRTYPSQVYAVCYQRARRDAARQAKLPVARFPKDPPFAAEDALDEDFMPGRPWSPDELAAD